MILIIEGSDYWSMPNVDPNYDRLPIRAVFSGYEKTNADPKLFEIQLDFYEFRTKIQDFEIFQVSFNCVKTTL